MSIIHKIKNGKKNHKIINFPNSEEKVAIISLPSNTSIDCKVRSDEYIEKEKITDEHYKDLVLQQYLAYEFLRDPENLDKKVADSVDEIRNNLDVQELAFLVMQYNLFNQEHSPFLQSVTEEQFDALKKTLVTMNWKDLSGESLVALRNFLMSLV